MKGIGKTVISIFMVGFFVVLYVHGQVSLLQVSYEIDSKSETAARLAEEYRHLKFEVDQLKAPSLLESKMKQHALQLTLPQEIRVVRVPVVPVLADASVQKVSSNPMMDQLSNFFGRWIDVAQAETNDNT